MAMLDPDHDSKGAEGVPRASGSLPHAREANSADNIITYHQRFFGGRWYRREGRFHLRSGACVKAALLNHVGRIKLRAIRWSNLIASKQRQTGTVFGQGVGAYAALFHMATLARLNRWARNIILHAVYAPLEALVVRHGHDGTGSSRVTAVSNGWQPEFR